MQTIESKITSKGQVSVPMTVRQHLDLGPGTRIQWIEKNGEVMVRRASRFTSQEIHAAIFHEAKPTVSTGEMDKGIQAYMKKKYARR